MRITPKATPKATPKGTQKVTPKVAAGRPAITKVASIPQKIQVARPQPMKPGSAVPPRRPGAVAVVAAAKPRKSRPRISPSGGPVAAWLSVSTEQRRPSSFIPAPPRAEAPSTVAAPPASSDRLIHPADLAKPADYRTAPVRVDIELSGARMEILVNPQELTLRAGDGVEWDFRYFGGADVLVQEIVVEFEKPSPFSRNHTFRSQKPGSARPHRQISGASVAVTPGKPIAYTIRCISAFKSDLGRGTAYLVVLA